jgi:hypothetical protein
MQDMLEVTFKGTPAVVMAALRDVVGGMELTAADMVECPELGSNVINIARASSRRQAAKSS